MAKKIVVRIYVWHRKFVHGVKVDVSLEVRRVMSIRIVAVDFVLTLCVPQRVSNCHVPEFKCFFVFDYSVSTHLNWHCCTNLNIFDCDHTGQTG